jgi:hypothetical protein
MAIKTVQSQFNRVKQDYIRTPWASEAKLFISFVADGFC